jgi:hypothetical protein
MGGKAERQRGSCDRDLPVCKLYDLTEEEIRIVEGMVG